MANILWVVFTIFALPYLSEGANILVVFPFPSKSHNILGEGFIRALLKDGHKLTYITPFPKKDEPNVRFIDVSKNMENFPGDISNLKSIIDKTVEVNNFKVFFHLLLNLSNSTFASEQVKKLINDPNEKFDLVIIEWMFAETYVGFSALYECPYIWFSSVDPHSAVLSLIDEPLNPAYNPQSISSNVPPFTFFQRIKELVGEIFMQSFRTFFLLPAEKQIYEETFGSIMAKKGKPLPALEEVRFNASLMFGNSDVSIGKATRLPQNYKPIGGYHIDPNVKPLPEELKKIMESSKNGVIYFSMGSNLKSKDLPDEIKKSLLKMFGELKYTVIWKFEEQLSGVPKNVHIVQWAPQPSILAHPKCKVFVTHGGLLSTIEAVNFGVPIIGIPVLADQHVNVEVSKKKGFALRVDLSYNMADELKSAIEEILSSPKYKEKVDELNLIFHDRPVSPQDELRHWVNHVMRTKGAPHLRSVALLVPWYQKMYLDLLAIVLVVIIVVVKVVKMLCCSRKKVASVKHIEKEKKNGKKKTKLN